ncbi:hypothetical protein ARMSODRAFT_968143 [Armillaria solidipes]|uniref:Uncharacterized protein n=1 Tax=Armillaria solidipes TaxID=1076256 RepID=A0A2H3C7I3_9AGAR|nr:hypothetical protein ARMSODRAFT_968143 [Armillaria solidipes]
MKAVKVMESGKGKSVVKVVEAALVSEEKGMDGDTEGEKLEATKEKALQQLKEKHNGKQKPSEPVRVESREEGILGPSKKTKIEVTGSVKNEEKLQGNINALVNKVDQLTGKVTFLQSYIGNSVDNFDTEDIESSKDILSVSNVEE